MLHYYWVEPGHKGGRGVNSCSSLQDRGNTPLHVASQAGQAMQVELLVVHGANSCTLDRLGHTPEECARWEEGRERGKEGEREGGKEGRKEGRREGRKEGRREGGKEGRESRMERWERT